jgi:hypothetical protein
MVKRLEINSTTPVIHNRKYITQRIHSSPKPFVILHNKLIFYREELLVPHPNPKLEDHPLSAVYDCLFKIFAAASISGGQFLHLQPKDGPCCGDGDPHNKEYIK